MWQKIKKNNQFISQIKHLGKIMYLGCYNSEEAAARSYDDMALKLRPNNCVLNFPKEVNHDY